MKDISDEGPFLGCEHRDSVSSLKGFVEAQPAIESSEHNNQHAFNSNAGHDPNGTPAVDSDLKVRTSCFTRREVTLRPLSSIILILLVTFQNSQASVLEAVKTQHENHVESSPQANQNQFNDTESSARYESHQTQLLYVGYSVNANDLAE